MTEVGHTRVPKKLGRFHLLLLWLLASFGCGGGTPPTTNPFLEVNPWTLTAEDLVDGTLNAAWSFGDELIVVGGTPGNAAVLWLRDGVWTRDDVPHYHMLWWVHGITPDDVWAVGEGGAALHYLNGEWTRVDLGTTAALAGVWGASSDDVWIVGGRPKLPNVPPMAWRIINGEPQEVELPDSGGGAFLKVWGDDDGTIYIVGQQGKFLVIDESGANFQPSGFSDNIVTVVGGPDGNVYAVGGAAQGAIFRYDGSELKRIETAEPLPGLMGITFDPEGGLWVAGRNGYIARSSDFGVTFDEGDVPTLDAFHGITVHQQSVLGLGGNLLSGKYELTGVLAHHGLPELPILDLGPISHTDSGPTDVGSDAGSDASDISDSVSTDVSDTSDGTDSGFIDISDTEDDIDPSDTEETTDTAEDIVEDPGPIEIVEPGGFCEGLACTEGYTCESLAFDMICTRICEPDLLPNGDVDPDATSECLADFGEEACCLAPPDLPGIPSPGFICHPDLFCNGAGW